jgi:hypothetical protein
MLSVANKTIMLSVVVLNVFMLSVVMLNVMAPKSCFILQHFQRQKAVYYCYLYILVTNFFVIIRKLS